MKSITNTIRFFARTTFTAAFLLCVTQAAQTATAQTTGAQKCPTAPCKTATAKTATTQAVPTKTATVAAKTTTPATSFSSVEDGFGINFPVPPSREVRKLRGGGEQVQLSADQEDGTSMVAYQELTNPITSNEDVRLRVEAARDGILKAFGGEVLREKDLKLKDGTAARELIVSIPDSNGEFRVRLFANGGRFYQVAAVGSQDFVRSAEMTAFIDSFEFVTATPDVVNSNARTTTNVPSQKSSFQGVRSGY